MFIYESTTTGLLEDVENEKKVDRLYDVYQKKIGRTSRNEIRSWIKIFT